MIGVAEDYLGAQLFKFLMRLGLDRGLGTHRHEYRGIELAMRGSNRTGSREPVGGLDLEFEKIYLFPFV